MDRVVIDRFYDDIGFTSVSWEAVEEAVGKHLGVAMEAWRAARGAEAEAYLPVLWLRPPRGYSDAYIDLHMLANTVLVRHVKRRYTRPEDVEHYVLVLGELRAEPPESGGNSHGHGSTVFRLEWYADMLRYLEVTGEEMREYERLLRENVGRVETVLRHGVSSASYLVILKAWEEKTLLRSIDRIVGVYVERNEPYLVYMEDHRSDSEETVYLFRMARLVPVEHGGSV